MSDEPGQAATSRDSIYSLTVEQAADLYARAGHPRTLRTVQRYCASGHLDCVKEVTMIGEKFFVEPNSVARHLAQIEELVTLESRTTSRDLPRLAATEKSNETIDDRPRQGSATKPDMSAPDAARRIENASDNQRQGATPQETVSPPVTPAGPDSSRYVAQLEREVERANEDRDFLREQIKTKDVQIAALLERDRETNILVGSLQRMLAPLLGQPRGAPRHEPEPDAI